MLHDVSTISSQWSRRWNRRDSIHVAVLAVVNIALRFPFLHVPILNIDEAEYMANGAYAQATGQTAFIFSGTSYTAGAFKISARLFGNYNPAPVRIAIALIAFAVAVLIYRWLARDTSRGLALACAILFSAWNFAFQGAVMEREWPCILAILSGANLFMRAQRRSDGRGPWLVFAAGLTTSLALFFKEQAAYMTLAAPLWLAYKAAETRRWRPWLGQTLFFLCGGLTGGAIYVTPFLIDGTLLAHIEHELKFGAAYTSGSDATAFSLPLELFVAFTKSRPVRLFLLAWVWFFLQGARALWRLKTKAGKGGCARRDRQLLAILYFGTATAVVQMGGNFFPHYFLFWIPFAFIVEGYAIHFLIRLRANRPAGVILAAIIISLILATIRFVPPTPFAWPAAGGAVVLAVAALIWFRRPIAPRRLRGIISATMVVLAIVTAVPQVRRSAAPEAEGPVVYPGPEAREFFARHGNPSQDRLFVWGWEPEFYVYSRLEPANRFVVCNGVFTSFWNATAIDESAADQIMVELRARPPRFIVTALPTEELLFHMYALRKFPALEKWMQGEYHRVAELPDCEVYERNSPPPATPSVNDSK